MPNEFQEVEWIGSNKDAYIDTDFIPNTDTQVEIKCTFDSGAASATMMGCASGGATTFFGIPVYSNSFGIVFYYNSWHILGNKTIMSFGDILVASLETTSTNAIATATNENTQWTNTVVQNGTLTSSRPIYLFCVNNNGSVAEKSSGKIYYFKATQNGQQARDMIPCYRKSDDEIGMYDTVTQTFFTNSGTGTFTKGNDVN